METSAQVGRYRPTAMRKEMIGQLEAANLTSQKKSTTSIAVYLPFAPFLLYFGAFIGWLILCGKVTIAAPLWAVMHLSPGGGDMMGAAKPGYMLLLGLLLRPALIVLGFVFALTALDVVAQGFNGIFMPAFKIAMAGSVMGLGTWDLGLET